VWVGYKVHLTETRDDDQPHLITHIETSAVPTADGDLTPTIHQALGDKDLLPAMHISEDRHLSGRAHEHQLVPRH